MHRTDLPFLLCWFQIVKLENILREILVMSQNEITRAHQYNCGRNLDKDTFMLHAE